MINHEKYAILLDCIEFQKTDARRHTLTEFVNNRTEVYEEVEYTFDDLDEARGALASMPAVCYDMGGYWYIRQYRLAEWVTDDDYDEGGYWSLDNIDTQELTTAPTDVFGRPQFNI